MATKHKAPKLTIKNKQPGKLLTGMNTELFLDGKKLRSVTAFKLETSARGVAKLTLEMYVDVGTDS